MICPICKHDGARRSRRQNPVDYVFSVISVYPWRCQSCKARFHARPMPLSHTFHAHCAICGNIDLKRISGDYVETISAFVWRTLRIPAFRCDPCRHKFFSILPMYEVEEHEHEAELSSVK